MIKEPQAGQVVPVGYPVPRRGVHSRGWRRGGRVDPRGRCWGSAGTFSSAGLAVAGEAEGLQRLGGGGAADRSVWGVVADQEPPGSGLDGAGQVVADQVGVTLGRHAIEQQVHVVEALVVRRQPVDRVTRPDPVCPVRQPPTREFDQAGARSTP